MSLKPMMSAACIASAFLLPLLSASPAAACVRTFVVGFEPDSARVAEKDSVASFLAVPSYGKRQKIVVRVSAPLHDLARTRALALAGLIQSHGIDPKGIMIETNRNAAERAVVIVYPPPHVVDPPAQAQATPPRRPGCGG